MLRVRLIPTLLLKDGRMIKTKQFDAFRDVGNPTTVAKVYDAQKADELIFLDVSATDEERNALQSIISAVAEECFMPLTVGGGIRTIDQARALLQHGADKVAINTAAVEEPSLVSEVSNKFGVSTVVVSIDYKRNNSGELEVFTHRGRHPTGLHPVLWAQEVQKRGAGEILLTSIDHEGVMGGYDIETIRAVADAVGIPVIAHGGAGTVKDFIAGITDGHASAVAAASIFHFTDQTIFKGHSYMRQGGLPVRL